ncbi:hypothetical protein [Rhodanobacter sp. FW106-PBR-R2A-1-13]|uniref:hypothetical protein n=1 Tax=Rhodanobacter sp. FW106-PBR-R2A-1-13 TaxID=3454845 RepID=UPI0034E603BC
MYSEAFHLDSYECDVQEAVKVTARRQVEAGARRETERHLADPHCGEFLATFAASRRYTEQ